MKIDSSNEHRPQWRMLLLVLVLSSSSVLVTGLNLDGILLLSFKYSAISDPLGVLSSWNYDDETPCSWNGVICAAFHGNFSGGNGKGAETRVISLVLPNAELLGKINGDLGFIKHLRHLDLSGNYLNGTLPSSLFNASELRVLSLSDNEISGEIPDLFGKIGGLEVVNLSDNALVGRIPESLGQLPNLTAVSLSNNYLGGNIHGGYRQAEVVDFGSNLVKGKLPENEFGGEGLRYLNFSDNRLSGEIPDSFGLSFSNNVVLDLSFNNLSGSIPAVASSLAVQKPAAFVGNPGLCGKPLKKLCRIPSTLSGPPPNGSPPAFAAIPKSVDGGSNAGGSNAGGSRTVQSKRGGGSVEKHDGMKPITVAGIIIGDLAGIGFLSMLFLLFYHLRKNRKNQQERDGMTLKPTRIDRNVEVHQLGVSATTTSSDKRAMSKLSICIGAESNNVDDISEMTASDTDAEDHVPEKKKGLLVTVDSEIDLDLETLLKASAFIIGATGSSIVYKAVLSDGTSFAVRRIGDGDGFVKLKDFESHVRNISKLRHPNLVRIRGFYWGSDEKLLISDFAANGSLANISYKKMRSSPFHLTWDLRLRIAKGVARGLAYLHEKKAVHGNLKPSNILLGAEMDAMLGDMGLERVGPNSGHSTSGTWKAGSSFRKLGNSKRSTLSQRSLEEPSPSPLSGTSSSRYQAPECMQNLKPNWKWDVYSFGMVLLELLIGRALDEGELVEWNDVVFAPEPEERNRVLRLADRGVRGEVVGKEDVVLSCFRLGFSCASVAPQRRPSMKEVAHVLDRIPYSSSSSYFSIPES